MKKQTKLTKQESFQDTWFYKIILNDRAVTTLFVLFLLFLTIFIYTKVSFILKPLKLIFKLVGPSLVFSLLIYYLLIPIVRYFEKKGLSRKLTVLGIFLTIFLMLGLGAMYLVPAVENQILDLIDSFPLIWQTVLSEVEEFAHNESVFDFYQKIQGSDLFTDITNHLNSVLTFTVNHFGSVIGQISKIGLTIATIPFVLYYLLIEGSNYKQGIIEYTPTKLKPTMIRFLNESSEQVGSYVRGELLVGVNVFIIFYVGYSIIGLDYALLISILAGVLNLIPYLGSIVSALPAMILGIFVSPLKLAQVLLVLVVEQTIEGRIISPQILGNKLDIHPLIILFILLVSGSLFGFMGLVLAIPGFAVLKVIWSLFFEWFKEKYNLYE